VKRGEVGERQRRKGKRTSMAAPTIMLIPRRDKKKIIHIAAF
jgi:hypothetical protein